MQTGHFLSLCLSATCTASGGAALKQGGVLSLRLSPSDLRLIQASIGRKLFLLDRQTRTLVHHHLNEAVELFKELFWTDMQERWGCFL